MIQFSSFRKAGAMAVGAVAVGIALSGLSGCNGLELPIEVTVPLIQNSAIVAANEADGDVNIAVGAFCDLFSEEELDALIRQFGGDLVADLVDITGVELTKVTVTATEGDFDSFTDSDLKLIFLGASPLPLGEASDSQGLGGSFDLTQDEPVDLLNDLEDGDCGAPTLHFEGDQPAGDIRFNTTATLTVYTRLTLQQP
ncbi:MAG: hypothetical protein JNK74_27160 [Candidatus Hydrogenedentes bacterium]|nr:hypothetical protein [Candidatus Hydrogenedentota bacterium]